MMKKESVLFILAAASAALLGAYLVWHAADKFPFHSGPLKREAPQAAESGAVVVPAGPKAGLNYEGALRQYDSTNYRFQFVGCSGKPGLLTVKQGVNFMLDNRDPVQHVFGVAGKNYTIKAYDFAIVSASPVGTYHITCDGKGAADLNIEK